MLRVEIGPGSEEEEGELELVVVGEVEEVEEVVEEVVGLDSSPFGALAGIVVPGTKNVYWWIESS